MARPDRPAPVSARSAIEAGCLIPRAPNSLGPALEHLWRRSEAGVGRWNRCGLAAATSAVLASWRSQSGILEIRYRLDDAQAREGTSSAFTDPARQERITHLDCKQGRVAAQNLVGSAWQPPSAAGELALISPWTGKVIGSVGT